MSNFLYPLKILLKFKILKNLEEKKISIWRKKTFASPSLEKKLNYVFITKMKLYWVTLKENRPVNGSTFVS